MWGNEFDVRRTRMSVELEGGEIWGEGGQVEPSCREHPSTKGIKSRGRMVACKYHGSGLIVIHRTDRRLFVDVLDFSPSVE
jgi:hypothetical protein